MPVKVLTNHKGLEYFMTTKRLTPRQARWAEFLFEFNFVVIYQTGKKNDKANALTRRPNKRPISNEDERQEHRMQVLLPPDRIEIQLIEVTNETGKEAKVFVRSHSAEPHAEPQPEHKESVETKDLEEGLVELPTLPDQVKESNQNNSLFTKICEYLANPMDHDRLTDVYLRGSRAANGLLYKDNKLWVTDDLRLDVIREVHDQPAVGHAGIRKTILLIQQHYFWPKMKQDVNRYIQNCHVCRRAKAPRD